MRKAIAIFFLSLFLLSYTELGQLVNLPKILTHYFEHKKWNPEVGFFAYFQMHYFTDDNIQGDDAKDKQLPFKEHKDCQPNNSINFAFNPVEISIEYSSVQSTVVYPQLRDEIALSSFTGSIFQPPRA